MIKNAIALIPAFNEEKNIKDVIARSRPFFPEILVSDDGSTDDTVALAEKSGAVVVMHTVNLGKGAAIKTGMEYILKNRPSVKYIVIIDADLQLDPEDSPRMVEPLVQGKADVVMGARDFSSVPFRHRLGNFVWKTSFNLLFGTRLSDTNCGFVALSRRAAEKIGSFHGGYIIESHLLAEAVKNGLEIRQVPVRVSYGRVSAVRRGIRMVAGVLFFILFEGVKYRLRFK